MLPFVVIANACPLGITVVVCQQGSALSVMLSCLAEGVHSGRAPSLERRIRGQEQAFARQLAGAVGLAGFHLPGGGIVQPPENCPFLMQGFLSFRSGAPVGGGALQENVPRPITPGVRAVSS